MSITLYRNGDWLEAYGEDAVNFSKCLGLLLQDRMGDKFTFIAAYNLERYRAEVEGAGYKIIIEHVDKRI